MSFDSYKNISWELGKLNDNLFTKDTRYYTIYNIEKLYTDGVETRFLLETGFLVCTSYERTPLYTIYNIEKLLSALDFIFHQCQQEQI
ncbi:hypothetical protein [Limnoraphis robusta]|uniref:Uncharacterized protein n=1 Tax=Limnoraphis robusta CS-951 TaxID=1637645 RepID=A0A0F5YA03_9CYAN|nr:hypothetical protein [Limnoraphis robusta]KKD35593.1 hypothetical protein WN50_24500 [Limnoraphis robusta CS-951]